MNVEKKTNERPWERTDSRARPKDGEKAHVRPHGDAAPLILIFRGKPIARWESLDGTRVYDFQFFEEWRRV